MTIFSPFQALQEREVLMSKHVFNIPSYCFCEKLFTSTLNNLKSLINCNLNFHFSGLLTSSVFLKLKWDS